MTELEVFDIVRDMMFLILKVITPLLSIVLITGLVIAIFQALTQIQESTLSFAPKIIAVIVGLILFAPYIGHNFSTFTSMVMDKIVNLP